jgi:hypothetical protein
MSKYRPDGCILRNESGEYICAEIIDKRYCVLKAGHKGPHKDYIEAATARDMLAKNHNPGVS